jgi:glutaminase
VTQSAHGDFNTDEGLIAVSSLGGTFTATVPEPATLALLGAAVLGVGAVLRRRGGGGPSARG